MTLAWTGFSFSWPGLCICIVLSLISLSWSFHPFLLSLYLFLCLLLCKTGLCRAGSLCCGSLQVFLLLFLSQNWTGCLVVLGCFFSDHDHSSASSLLTCQPSYQDTRKATQIVIALPKPPCLVPWVGILSWEGWERCPTVCSRLLGKTQGFS